MRMAKMIQVRNVSDRLHRELTRRARRRGQTLTAFVEEILEREAARPAPDEVAARLRSREPGDISPQDIVRWIREDRGRLPRE
jgi:plasmid stability protein